VAVLIVISQHCHSIGVAASIQVDNDGDLGSKHTTTTEYQHIGSDQQSNRGCEISDSSDFCRRWMQGVGDDSCQPLQREAQADIEVGIAGEATRP
jgi:hypothetical protein